MTTQVKQYRLLVALPELGHPLKGAVSRYDAERELFWFSKDDSTVPFSKYDVEDCTNWFKELKEPKTN